MESIYWLAFFIILLVIEILTLGLTTIWFAGGALVAFIACLLGAGLGLQIALFAVVSVVLLFFTRPLALKYLNKRTTKTNVESLIGKTAKVTVPIDNYQGVGAAMLNGLEWTARSVKDEETIAAGTLVTVVEISGVKLIVKKKEEELV